MKQNCKRRFEFVSREVKAEQKKGYIVIPPYITQNKEKLMKDFEMTSGIDSLYCFCESNEKYKSFYLNIEKQLEDKKIYLEEQDIKFQNKDIFIDLDDTSFNYLGKGEGFHWFKDLNEFFKIGFKDPNTNEKVHNIRVQLQSIGIYTVGIKSLLEYINEDLLKNYVTGYNPITRADLNCFINFCFSSVTKDLFVTKKKHISTIHEIGNSRSLQTLYIGKPPFKMRLYNKIKELETSNKQHLMYEYFISNGLSITEPLWNLEFEMHREHLKSFNIDTVDDLLKNCNNLFKRAMDDIRLIDPYSISEKDLKHNRYKAENEEIWDYMKDLYDVKEFLQISTPLEKIKKRQSFYDDVKFKVDLVEVLNKGFTNEVFIDLSILNDVYLETIRFIKNKTPAREVKKSYTEALRANKDGGVDTIRILEDGTEIKPVNVVSLSSMSDFHLMQYVNELKNNKSYSEHDANLYYVAHKEAYKRGLVDFQLPNI